MEDDSVCNYEVGDKVVCIDDNFFEGVKALYKELPKADQTYVVREIRLGIAFPSKIRTGGVSVLLVGLVNPKSNAKPFRERGFAYWRFVKLEEYKAVVKEIKTAIRELEKTVV